jgi:hypothetical protein
MRRRIAIGCGKLAANDLAFIELLSIWVSLGANEFTRCALRRGKSNDLVRNPGYRSLNNRAQFFAQVFRAALSGKRYLRPPDRALIGAGHGQAQQAGE